MTENASQLLKEWQVEHQVIPVPEDLDYKTGSDTCIYLAVVPDNIDVPMALTKAKVVVMRVFREHPTI